MKRKMSQLVLAASLSLASMATYAATALVYKVNLTGTANGNVFNRTGLLLITDSITQLGTRNGVNPVDVALFSGNPTGSPSTGAIQAVTNTKLAGLNGSTGPLVMSALDLAYVSATNNGNCISVKPDQTSLLALYDANPDIFTASSSLVAQIYYVQLGELSVCSSDGYRNLNGTINLYGSSYFGGFQPTIRYLGALSGSVLGKITF